jgi:hypothetical protein
MLYSPYVAQGGSAPPAPFCQIETAGAPIMDRGGESRRVAIENELNSKGKVYKGALYRVPFNCCLRQPFMPAHLPAPFR